ncbi:uncharacterized protein LOC141915354 [Tubulanus polymorphus]|uniref:uncharacterized protein LOC141915354 n=1 Tax=Tubulanus polymorphus TaxID=672921 RepID=UPI003DA4871D
MDSDSAEMGSDVRRKRLDELFVTNPTQSGSPSVSPRKSSPSPVLPSPRVYPSYGKPVAPGYTTNTRLSWIHELEIQSSTSNRSLKESIPIMPKSLAVICFLFNITVPGLGTFLAGLSLFCCGKPRLIEEDDVTGFLNNTWTALLQLLSTPLLLIGWIWSVVWGVLFLKLSVSEPLDYGGNGSTAQSRRSTDDQSEEPPMIVLQEAPVTCSVATIQATRDLQRLNLRHQRNGRNRQIIDNRLDFLREGTMDDLVRVSAAVFGMSMISDDNTAAAAGPSQEIQHPSQSSK